MTLVDWLLRQPWFYRSPGPLSLAYYGVIIFLGARVLQRRVEYKRWRWPNSLSESFFLNGFIVLGCDFFWMWASAARFLPDFPQDAWQVLFVLGRNVVGCLLCWLVVGDRIKEGVVEFKESTFCAYIFLIFFLTFLFTWAESPVYTDWTYAIRVGAPTSTILLSLVVSYGLGKAVGAYLVYTWWKNG